MAQAALLARTSAAASLKESIRRLTKFKDSGNPSKRLLENKLDEVITNKQELIRKHHTYAEKANKDLDDAELTGWITPRLDDADDISDEVMILIENIENTEETRLRTLDKAASENKEKDEIQLSELQCTTNERSLRERVHTMKELIGDVSHTTKADADAARSYLSQVDESLGELTKSWNILKWLPSLDGARLTEI